MSDTIIYRGGFIFDGQTLHAEKAAVFDDGVLVGLVAGDAPVEGKVVDLVGGILSPGFVDLQVNGGGGVMLNEAPSVATLERIAQAHRQLGACHILPTLITDDRETTQAAVAATIQAIKAGVPGVVGLHLEGPHLSVARKGAHDADMIRPMEPEDLQMLLAAASDLPVLKVTVAPENVSLAQVSAMEHAGILVALGHTDADCETCVAYAKAGARLVTHLFNAMSQLTARAPGLVGAALSQGGLSAGLIADGIHVHPDTMRAAWAAKARPGQIYLVSDAMAVAGSAARAFYLGERKILRQDGRLTLPDGTLAGADLDLATAVGILSQQVGVELNAALRAATTVPAGIIGMEVALQAGKSRAQDVIHIAKDFSTATPIVG